MSFDIRRAEIADAQALAGIESEREFTANWRVKGIETELGLEHSVILCGLENGVVAGFIALKIFAPQAEIVNFAVGKKFGGKGCGTALLKKAIEYAADNKCNTIFLDVNAQNITAQKLYAKCGFKISALRKKFYSDASDAVGMILEIGL